MSQDGDSGDSVLFGTGYFLSPSFLLVNNLPYRINAENKYINFCNMLCTMSEAQETPSEKMVLLKYCFRNHKALNNVMISVTIFW